MLRVRLTTLPPQSVFDQGDRAFRAGARGLPRVEGLVVRHVEHRVAVGDVAVVVEAEQVRGQGVAAPVTGAPAAVDGELHAGTCQVSGRLNNAIMLPPPRSISGSSAATSKSGTALSHSSTATCITRRARCAPRQRCGPPAKPRWLLALRSRTNSSARSYIRGSRFAPETRP